MTKNFRAITDELFATLEAQDLASAIGCSLGAVKQARMKPGAGSYRAPPPGWEAAAKKLAERRAEYFTKLARKLAP